MNTSTPLLRATVAAACLAAAAGALTAAPAHAEGEDSYLVRGRIVSALTHTPLPGICVRQESTDHWSDVELGSTSRGTNKVAVIERAAPTRDVRYGTSDDCLGGVFTDEDGLYEFAASPWTMTDITATDYAGTYVRTVVGVANGEPGEVRDLPDTQMKVGGTIRGTAVDAETGEPVAGACPSAIRGAASASMSLAIVTCSGSDGVWSLTGLAQGRYRVSLTTFGYEIAYAGGATTLKAAKAYRSVAGSKADVGAVALTATGELPD